jgi:hypothetical protein
LPGLRIPVNPAALNKSCILREKTPIAGPAKILHWHAAFTTGLFPMLFADKISSKQLLLTRLKKNPPHLCLFEKLSYISFSLIYRET